MLSLTATDEMGAKAKCAVKWCGNWTGADN